MARTTRKTAYRKAARNGLPLNRRHNARTARWEVAL